MAAVLASLERFGSSTIACIASLKPSVSECIFQRVAPSPASTLEAPTSQRYVHVVGGWVAAGDAGGLTATGSAKYNSTWSLHPSMVSAS